MGVSQTGVCIAIFFCLLLFQLHFTRRFLRRYGTRSLRQNKPSTWRIHQGQMTLGKAPQSDLPTTTTAASPCHLRVATCLPDHNQLKGELTFIAVFSSVCTMFCSFSHHDLDEKSTLKKIHCRFPPNMAVMLLSSQCTVNAVFDEVKTLWRKMGLAPWRLPGTKIIYISV